MDEWPPADSDALLGRWRDLGQPELQLSPGVTIHNLERWFYPQVPHEPPYREVQRVRGQLEQLIRERARAPNSKDSEGDAGHDK